MRGVDGGGVAGWWMLQSKTDQQTVQQNEQGERRSVLEPYMPTRANSYSHLFMGTLAGGGVRGYGIVVRAQGPGTDFEDVSQGKPHGVLDDIASGCFDDAVVVDRLRHVRRGPGCLVPSGDWRLDAWCQSVVDTPFTVELSLATIVRTIIPFVTAFCRGEILATDSFEFLYWSRWLVACILAAGSWSRCPLESSRVSRSLLRGLANDPKR